MKYLNVLGFYRLPENFDGSLSDALRLLAEHLDDNTKPFVPPKIKFTQEVKTANNYIFEEFWNSSQDFVGFGVMSKYNKTNNTFTKMDMKL